MEGGGKNTDENGTKKLDTLAFLITKQVADHAAAMDIKDGKRTTDLPHNAGDITMVSILSIIEENLPTKSSKTWTLFEKQ